MRRSFLIIVFILFLTFFFFKIHFKENLVIPIESFILKHWDNRTKNFNDDFSKSIFSIEKLKPLPSFNNFNLTYRKLDIYFALLILNETYYDRNSRIYQLIEESRIIISKIIPLWRNQSLIVSKNNYTGLIWLDTYCILAYLTRDKQLVENIINHLDFNKSLWIDERLYRNERVSWRLISDEIWCIIAISRGSENRTLLKKLVDYHLKDALNYLKKDHWKLNKLGVLIHLIMMLNTLKKEGFYNKTLENLHKSFINQAIELINQDELYKNVDLTANLIWVICESGFAEEYKKEINFLMEKLLEQRKEDGGIYNREDAKGFLTLQALKAIYAYEKVFG